MAEEVNQATYRHIEDLVKEGKVDQDLAKECRQRFSTLHQLLEKNMDNEKKLIRKSRALKQQLQNENLKLQKIQTQQKEATEKINQLQKEIREAGKQSEIIDQRKAALEYDINLLDNQKTEKLQALEERQLSERQKLRPEIEKLERDLKEKKEEIKDDKARLEKDAKHCEELERDIDEQQNEIDKQTDEISKTQDEYIKIKEDPTRIEKTNENLQKGVNVLQDEEKALDEEIIELGKRVEMKMEEQQKVKDILTEKKNVIQGQINDLENRSQKLMELDNKIRLVETEYVSAVNTREEIDQDMDELKRARKQVQDEINQTQKDIEAKKKIYKRTQFEDVNCKNTIKELTTQKQSTQKFIGELESEQRKQQKVKEDIEKENTLFLAQYDKKRKVGEDCDKEVKKVKEDIMQAERDIAKLQQDENKWIIEIKCLSSLRENMARQASMAMAQARETREDLKVKELIIIDLTKKKQETEFKLNSFIALYQEVRNARNKYVNMIQNSSQDLAEMKERIKILQNQVEILRNQSSEKDSALVGAKHQAQLAMYQRDSHRAELNKKQYTNKTKKAIITQHIMEVDKLNLIINSLQKDMNDLITKYEVACESRNYMGIQLIDRNDELCILYEKANIQENILKNGEQEIRKKEDDIRMLSLELSEKQRSLEVERQKMPDVPIFAEQVVSKNDELAVVKLKVKDLSEQLEDPMNVERFRDLGGEDPDQESLQIKIQVLEERLNNKKEALLEKELVLEQVSNLAEKLRKQALDGRKTTLELVEKINQYKARTNDLSRKLLATISELSMFQSKAEKLQQEKDELENQLEHSQKRLNNGLPPGEESESLFQQIIRREKVKEQILDESMQRKQLEASLPPFGVMSHAIPRLQSYQLDEFTLPRPYDNKFQPFKPTVPGSTMRHIRKPEIQNIEV